MYTVKLSDDILEVKGCYLSFCGTTYDYHYYDIKKWKKSLAGKKNDTPMYDMTKEEIEWVTKYYIPKIN